MLNIELNKFKKNHKKKLNQVLYISSNSNGIKEIENLLNNFLEEKNSFVFESVEKGKIKGRYTIFGKRPDKVWEFNNNKGYLLKDNKRHLLKGEPKEIIENIIENFKFKLPKELPNICALISGYFSYDIIRYIEKIPNKCVDDLKIPDTRILRPRLLIIHDNLKRKLFYIYNCFKEEKITNYQKKYFEIINELKNNIFLSNHQSNNQTNKTDKKISIKSNTTKKIFINNVKKAKKYIKLGDIFQVVLSQRFEASLNKTPLEIYKKLRVTNPSPFMFFFNFFDFQIVGASPEILVRLRKNKITIRPIAGTRPRGINKKKDNFYAKDLLNDK